MRKRDDLLREVFMIAICTFVLVAFIRVTYLKFVSTEERGYYLGIYQHCMDTEPQKYTIAITQDSHLPNIQDFSPICLEIVREYQRRNDYKLEHRGWQWPLE